MPPWDNKNKIMRNQRQITQPEEDGHAPTLQQILNTRWELQHDNVEARERAKEVEILNWLETDLIKQHRSSSTRALKGWL